MMLRVSRGRSFGVVIVVLGLAGSAAALEVRRPEGDVRYRGELTRAFVPCLAPNDVTPDGRPACRPAVGSSCAFSNGRVELRFIEGRTIVNVVLNDVIGPGDCADGPYAVQLGLRVTADGACGSAPCTFQDLVLSEYLGFRTPNDFQMSAALEDLLPIEFGAVHFEVLGATIAAPDGKAIAATGVGYEGFSVLAPMGTGYARCDVPDTTGALGPACLPPVWPSTCDLTDGSVEWLGASFGNPLLRATFKNLRGASDCGDGTYVVRSRLRITETCVSGSICTAVDVTASIPFTAAKGRIAGEVVPIASLPEFASQMLSTEVQSIDVQDPAGALFATPAVASVWDLEKPKVKISRRDPLSASDDLLRLEARFPLTAIDPTENPGVTFTVTDRNGPVYEVTIPGSLWQLGLPIGTRWDFEDPVGGINGVRQASIRQFTKGPAPAGYKIKLAVRGVDLSAADLPGVNVLVSIPKPEGFDVTTAQRNRACKTSTSSVSCK